MVPASEALERLREGNRRFVSGGATPAGARPAELAGGQKPFAIILGCADSRVPPELVFDQGLGELFVVRVAGNVATPTQVGSIEFAAEQFGARLVVVLGHSMCGAVAATLGQIEHPAEGGSPHVASIVDQIRPAVAPLLEAGGTDDRDALVCEAVRANVRASVDALRGGSEVLRGLAADDGLVVVGAEYSLQSGEVEFFADA